MMNQPYISPNGTKPMLYQDITVIINPVAGLQNVARDTIHHYLDQHPEFNITYYETTPDKTAFEFAQQAAKAGTQLVVAYGGDGTMTEVAAALQHSHIPMGILPGGTANVMATVLGIPTQLEQALDLIFSGAHQTRLVDMGCIDNQPFLLRAGIGYEAEFSATAPRAAKRAHGRLAYFQHAFALLRKLRPARYVIRTDGQTYVVRGITCMICNSTGVGVSNLQLVHDSRLDDGLLDVVVIEGLGLHSIARIMISVFQSILPKRIVTPPAVRHWQVKEVSIEIRPRQLVAFDGEKLKTAQRVSARVVPDAIQIIVPASAEQA